MKVKTLRRHGNAYKPQYIKNPGRKYQVGERVGRNLIAAGLVEEDKPDEAVSKD